MAYTLGNKCAKNCCKRTIPVQLIVEDVVTCFFGTQCRTVLGRAHLLPTRSFDASKVQNHAAATRGE